MTSQDQLEHHRNFLLAVVAEWLAAAPQGFLGASDVAQQTLLEARIAGSDFERLHPGQQLRWLRTAARNNLVDHIRRQYREKRLLESRRRPQETISATDDGEGAGRIDRLLNAVALLPRDYQTVIELRNFSKLGFAAIGKIMDNRSPDAVRMLWNRAVEMLRVQMGKDECG